MPCPPHSPRRTDPVLRSGPFRELSGSASSMGPPPGPPPCPRFPLPPPPPSGGHRPALLTAGGGIPTRQKAMPFIGLRGPARFDPVPHGSARRGPAPLGSARAGPGTAPVTAPPPPGAGGGRGRAGRARLSPPRRHGAARFGTARLRVTRAHPVPEWDTQTRTGGRTGTEGDMGGWGGGGDTQRWGWGSAGDRGTEQNAAVHSRSGQGEAGTARGGQTDGGTREGRDIGMRRGQTDRKRQDRGTGLEQPGTGMETPGGGHGGTKGDAELRGKETARLGNDGTDSRMGQTDGRGLVRLRAHGERGNSQLVEPHASPRGADGCCVPWGPAVLHPETPERPFWGGGRRGGDIK